MRKIFKYIGISFAMLPLFSVQAFAEDCSNLAGNSEWNTGLNAISSFYSSGAYENVIDTGMKLTKICSKSPMLHYFMAKAYHEKGDSQKELYFLQQATRNSQYMEVQADDLEKMWKDRIYLETPEVSPKAVEDLKKENEKLKSQMLSSNINAINDTTASIQHYKALMWTGVGVSGAGLAMIITGASLVATQKDKGIEFDDDKKPTKVRAKGAYVAGWTTLGVGIASTVVGGAFSGISGYYLSKAKKEDMVSFDVSPVSASMTIQF